MYSQIILIKVKVSSEKRVINLMSILLKNTKIRILKQKKIGNFLFSRITIVGVLVLNFSVRDGKRCTH